MVDQLREDFIEHKAKQEEINKTLFTGQANNRGQIKQLWSRFWGLLILMLIAVGSFGAAMLNILLNKI